jgi:hypothetical protein
MHSTLLAMAALVFAAATSAGAAAAAAPAPAAAKPRAQVGAYYFDGWAGAHDEAGKADWARNAPTHLTKRMLDEFPGREPVWGWRDDSLPVMERQIDLAADHGLAFFAFCWYWHEDEKAIRDDPKHTGLELFLKARNNDRMKFCLLVANHAGFEIKGEKAWRKAADLWMPYLAHKRHVTVGGKPLLVIFSPGGGDKAGFAYLQEAARKAGLPGIAVASCGPGPREMGYTHSTYYNVVPGWEKGLEEHKFQEFAAAHKASWKGSPEQPHIPCVSAGWDRRPWEPVDPTKGKCCWYYPDRTPEQFAASLSDAIAWTEAHPDQATAEKTVIIYAWNEFGEGGYMAPTKDDPDGKYLKALRSVVMP